MRVGFGKWGYETSSVLLLIECHNACTKGSTYMLDENPSPGQNDIYANGRHACLGQIERHNTSPRSKLNWLRAESPNARVRLGHGHAEPIVTIVTRDIRDRLQAICISVLMESSQAVHATTPTSP